MTIYILYNSKTGTTREYAKEIATFVNAGDYHAEFASIDDYDDVKFNKCDRIMLGTWTNSTIIIQHPDKKWRQFAKGLPSLNYKQTAFFTTCTLISGTLFNRMNRILNTKAEICLKSRNGHLSANDKKEISKWLQM